MKNAILLVFALCSINQAQAEGFKSPTYCHTELKNLCASISYEAKPVMGEAFEFVVDLTASDSDLAKVSGIKAELWMPSMGHGSAPVRVERIGANQFLVTEAYFVMDGAWDVNVEVMTSSGSLKFAIPFEL